MGKRERALELAQRDKPPLFVGYCQYRDCPFCGRDFFKWYKARMAQMSMLEEGTSTSFNDAAATSLRPVPTDVKPGTRVRMVNTNQAVMDWAKTGVVTENCGRAALDGVHRVGVRFTGVTSEWVWMVDIQLLALVC